MMNITLKTQKLQNLYTNKTLLLLISTKKTLFRDYLRKNEFYLIKPKQSFCVPTKRAKAKRFLFCFWFIKLLYERDSNKKQQNNS